MYGYFYSKKNPEITTTDRLDNYLLINCDRKDLLHYYLNRLEIPMVDYETIAIDPITKNVYNYQGNLNGISLTLKNFHLCVYAITRCEYIKHFSDEKLEYDNGKVIRPKMYRFFREHISLSTSSIQEYKPLYEFLKENVKGLDLYDDYFHLDVKNKCKYETRTIFYKEFTLEKLKDMLGKRFLASTNPADACYYVDDVRYKLYDRKLDRARYAKLR
jgi:hypothetical protein